MLQTSTRLWGLLPLATLLLGHRPALAQVERVGIGTASPTQVLDVNGNMRVRPLKPPGTNQLLVALPDGTLGLSQPLPSTAGLGLYAQVAGTAPVLVGSVGSFRVYTQVAAVGRYVFVAGSNQINVFDTQAAPTIPAPTGPGVRPSGTVGALAAGSNVLYVATSAGLEAFNIRSNDPSLPLTTLPTVALAPAGTTSSTIYDAVLAGRYLYVAARFNGSSYGAATVVRIFDLVTPTTPLLVATLPLGPSGRVQLAADESRGRLLVVPDAGPLQVYALATPTVPLPGPPATAPATAPVVPPFNGIAAVGGILYGANNATSPPSLAVYDAGSPADPAQPAPLGAVPLPPKPVRDLAVAGEYAYLLTADASSYELVSVRVAAPALVGLDAAGNVASVAPVLPPTDNLGNHRATQNLNLATFQLTGSGGSQGLRLDANGRVGVLTAPSSSYRLDVGGALRATTTATDTLFAPTLTTPSLRTPKLTVSATDAHPRLAEATGRVTSTGGNPTGSGNYQVAHPATGVYRFTFTGGRLSTANLQQAAVVAALAGSAGFVTFTASSANGGYIDVYTSGTNGMLSDRAFTFSVFLP